MNADGAVVPASVAGHRLVDYVALCKPRLNVLTVFAVAAGWWAARGEVGDTTAFAGSLAGAALVAGGASAVNQVIERRRDALMARTAGRPLPAGRLGPREALAFGVAASVLGTAIVLVAGNVLAAALLALCFASYVALYTPLKTRTSLNTLAGTLPGALPPVIGYAAATGTLAPAAWFLFALLVAWQLPHFLAIAWIHRRDYARAGFAMLPCIEGGEAATARQAVVQALLAVTVSLAALPLGLAGRTYFYVALGAGVVLLGAAAAFAVGRTDRAARTLLRVSVLHLPVVLVAFALDRA